MPFDEDESELGAGAAVNLSLAATLTLAGVGVSGASFAPPPPRFDGGTTRIGSKSLECPRACEPDAWGWVPARCVSRREAPVRPGRCRCPASARPGPSPGKRRQPG